MLGAVVVLLGCQLAGEALARATGLPIPGPVIGFALLFMALGIRAWLHPRATPAEATPLGAVAAVLLGNLSLLFVPAGTGIVQQGPVLFRHGPGLLVALVVSTALTLAVTGLVFAAVARRLRAPR